MSKPTPIEYHLKSWNITYHPDHYCEDGSMIYRGHYIVNVIWDTEKPKEGHWSTDTNNASYSYKKFKTLNEAMKYIEQETEVKL